MKYTEINVNEDGRIVKGVNTTVDVGVNQIPIEASKLGFKVDKEGRPPTLSKKVKGKSTNVLFNLGLSESNRKRNLTDFISFCKEQLELSSTPSIKFVSDTEDVTFGYFDNDNKNIVVQLKGRHQMDVMRTVAHELVHYKQDKVLGRELDGSDGSVDENEANSLAGVLLRRWGQKNPTLFTETVDNDTESSVYFTNMQEQLGEIASASEIYVDMDGVLADFFGEWARLMKVDHFTKIDKEHEIGDALQRIRDTDDFWLRLPMLPQARELLNLIKNVKGEYNICSTPLQDDPNSEKHKRTWIEKNLSSFPPKNIYITSDKPQYATNADGTPNILIDDFGRNVSQWEAAGGIGFKYKDHKFERTAKELQQHMKEPVKESVTYVKPQFDAEWEEANRYPFLDKLGKDGWIELAQTGKVTNVNSDTVKKIGNTGADGSESLDDLEPEKVARLKQAMDAGTIEMPIVIKQPNGSYDLVAGNTRLIGLMNTHREAKVWLVDASKLKQPVKENIVEWLGPVLTEDKQPTLTDYITTALKTLDKLFTKNKYEIRIVGGAVRDVALGKEPKDIDLATDATPTEMQKMFDGANIRHKPTGIEHGTITAILDGEDFEITTLRSDTNTDGRHAEVEFVRSWEEDAKRRDLTYNAMSMDFNGKVYDYNGGMDDLQNKVSKFVGDPEERIKEDYLRILRYFRFQGRLTNPKWDAKIITAIKDNSNGLSKVSVERIWQEMGKILSGNNVSDILKYMEKTGVTKSIRLQARNTNSVQDNQDAIISLARIVDNDSIAKTWKLSKDEHTTLLTLVKNKDKTLTQKSAEDLLVDGKNKDIISKLAELQDNKELVKYIQTFQMPTFPINGNDLMVLGISRGPEMGQVLQSLKTKWKQSNFTATKDELLSNVTASKDDLISENFADGKVKGKSKPGRVKKAGASCNGSVTSLRKKAKAGGEKGKMYHWCANMKAGRKK